tara:strand:- start:89 stop:982 length:894 start_codon:yes stop_codon:yes gene_type:complete
MKNNSFLNQYFKKRKSILRRFFIGFLVLIFCFGLIQKNQKPDDFIGKLTIDGIIHERQDLIEKLNDLEKNKKIRGLILIVNTPGGTFVSSKELYDSIKRLSKEIPTAVYMREIATSGGYLVSLSSDRIFGNSGTITGSIGVILQSTDLSELLEKIGINPVIIKSGEFKAVPNPLEKMDQKKTDYISKIVSLMQKEFLSILKESRNVSDDLLEIISDGRILTGRQAKDMNLIDEIGSETDAISWIKNQANLEDNIKIIDFTDEDNILNLFGLNFLKSKIRSFNLNSYYGLLAIWVPGL